ncbi:MAG: hypothetical protein WBL80_01630 [Erysipelotrichaceae bacterium]
MENRRGDAQIALIPDTINVMANNGYFHPKISAVGLQHTSKRFNLSIYIPAKHHGLCAIVFHVGSQLNSTSYTDDDDGPQVELPQISRAWFPFPLYPDNL